MHKQLCLVSFLLSALFLMTSLQAEPLATSKRSDSRQTVSPIDSGIDWPTATEIFRVVTLQNYNTRLVVLSTTVLGIAAGVVGSFLLLRKRSLMGDVLSHACLPGIGLFFMWMVALGSEGKNLPGLLLGATLTGTGGVGLVLLIRRTTRIKDDAAMGIVLSVFFGIGIVVLGMVQTMPGASASGLENYIYGKTASMVMQDYVLICVTAVIVVLTSILLLKEFTLLCFDEGFAASQGWPVIRLDSIMLLLVAAITVVGLQAVGLILIIAFLITPAASARFWTDGLKRMMLLAGLIGGLSGWLGASISALLPRLPAGAVIVLVATGMFLVSLIFGSTRGIIRRLLAHYRLRRKVGQQNLLRAIYEIIEMKQHPEMPVSAETAIIFESLLNHRSWSRSQLRQLIAAAQQANLIHFFDGKQVRLSATGLSEAARLTRNHRLWEMYLIQYADIAPSHVDRDADAVEHILGGEMVQNLENELLKSGRSPVVPVPVSPHALSEGAS